MTSTIFLSVVFSCSKDKEPPPTPVRAEAVANPLPRFLRGTVRYEADLEGYGAALANGYGIMVNLNGTGSSDIPVPVRTMLEQEAAKRLEDTRIDAPDRPKIDELLNSPNTAVVIVEGLIPAGATRGTHFDLLVRSLPGTSTTSLEGGVLWTTKLRIQPMDAKPGQVLDPVGVGRGDMFINPFAVAIKGENGESHTSVNKLTGRILNGGTMTVNMQLFLHLRTPNFSRSRSISDAINARFPIEREQLMATAVPMHGQSDERIRITVPPSWYGRSPEFIEILMNTPIFQAGGPARADALRRWVRENPVDAPSVAWGFVAIGKRALPAIEKLYHYPELAPRLAALKAGAKLGDPLVLPDLEEIARDDGNEFQEEAIQLLADLPPNPRSLTILRDLLNNENRTIQIAAFEGLRKNNDPLIQKQIIGPNAKFDLYAVPSDRPMVYIHQQGEPLVVLFGRSLKIKVPLLASAWGSSFMVMNEDPDEPLKVFYEDPKTGEARTYEPDRQLPSFIRFLARSGSYLGEAPGLGMTYAQTIGVLYALHVEKAMGGPLILQQDSIRKAITKQRDNQSVQERPESNEPQPRPESDNPMQPASQNNKPNPDRPESGNDK